MAFGPLRIPHTVPALVATIVLTAAEKVTAGEESDLTCDAVAKLRTDEPRSRTAIFYWRDGSPAQDTGTIAIQFRAEFFASPSDLHAKRLEAAHSRATHYIPLATIAENLRRCLDQETTLKPVIADIRRATYANGASHLTIEASEEACRHLPPQVRARGVCLAITEGTISEQR